MSLTSLILRFAAPIPRPESFRRYLMIGPHPDDIEIGAGATVSRLCREGREVHYLICTDGRFGQTDATRGMSGDELARHREDEARRAADYLGVSSVHFLRLKDGAGYTQEELLRGMAQYVGRIQPDILFAPDPFVPSECHQDHINTGMAAREVACFAAYPGIMAQWEAESAPVKAIAFYMTAHPNRYVGTRGHFARQQEAIFRCHASQFPESDGSGKAIATYLRLRQIDFGIRSWHLGAEGFRVLGGVHMHCLPEAGR